jgi:hypothetical protein
MLYTSVVFLILLLFALNARAESFLERASDLSGILTTSVRSTGRGVARAAADTSATSTDTTGSAKSASGYDTMLDNISKQETASIDAVNAGKPVPKASDALNGGSTSSLSSPQNNGYMTDPLDPSDPNNRALYASRVCMAQAATSGNTGDRGFYQGCLCDALFAGQKKPPQCAQQTNNNLLLILLMTMMGQGDS